MSMNIIDVPALLTTLRDTGNDTYSIEAKAAVRGMPGDIDETLSAFANMPEGGVILLGIAEVEETFEVTGVWNTRAAQDSLASKARQRIVPPIQLGAIEVVRVEGLEVVACVVPPQDSDRRPYRVGAHGPAYIRSGDGDYKLDEIEEQILIGSRGQPAHERQPVRDADVDHDLDRELVDEYLVHMRSNSRRLQKMSRDEQLIRTNVVDVETGSPTLAAVYAMGVFPQQFLPTLTVKARAIPPATTGTRTRMRNLREFTGPVPDLLEETLQWVLTNSTTDITFSGGRGRTVPEMPPIAVREVVANALVHRDLSIAAQSGFVNVVKKPNGLVVTSPGGLWGLTERQLGTTPPRTRNPILYAMCSAITTQEGNRVIEASATGIPEIRRALFEASLPEPRFKDNVISFEVLLSNSSLLSEEDIAWLSGLPGAAVLTVPQRHALVGMRHGKEYTNGSYRAAFPMDSVDARRELQELVAFGLAEAHGERGGAVYRIRKSDSGAAAASDQEVRNEVPHTYDAVEPDTSPEPARKGQRLSFEQKADLIRRALESASSPLTKLEIEESTGLSIGQLNPALTQMREKHLLEFTEPVRSPRQRYRLADS